MARLATSIFICEIPFSCPAILKQTSPKAQNKLGLFAKLYIFPAQLRSHGRLAAPTLNLPEMVLPSVRRWPL